jgi:prevent-host-death family protein
MYPTHTHAPPLLLSEPESVGAYEAKTHLAELLDNVMGGQRYVITRHGRPVARLIPVEAVAQGGAVAAAMLESRGARTLGLPIRDALVLGRK